MEECMNCEFKFGTFFKCLFLAVFVAIFVSCNIIPQSGKITIKNNSGEEVKNITVFYPHADGERTENINRLLDGESMTLDVEITNSSFAIGAGILSGTVEIEYYINDKKYGRGDGEGNNFFSDGVESIITINENGWSAERK
jgi:hypothetical protein